MIGIALIVAHRHPEPESGVQLKVPRSTRAILFGLQGRILREPQSIDLVVARARLVGIEEQGWLVMTHVSPAASGILARLRAQDPTHLVALKQFGVRG